MAPCPSAYLSPLCVCPLLVYVPPYGFPFICVSPPCTSMSPPLVCTCPLRVCLLRVYVASECMLPPSMSPPCVSPLRVYVPRYVSSCACPVHVCLLRLYGPSVCVSPECICPLRAYVSSFWLFLHAYVPFMCISPRVYVLRVYVFSYGCSFTRQLLHVTVL